MFFKYINFRIFFITFAIGLFYIYINDDYKKMIVIHPTPDNIGKYQYKDKSDNCFSYQMKEVKCPSENLIHNIQVQT